MTPRPRRAPAQASKPGAPYWQAVRVAQHRLRLQGAQADHRLEARIQRGQGIMEQHVQLHTPDYRRASSNEAACAAGMPTRTPAAWAGALQALMIPSR